MARTATEHAETVLSAIISGNGNRELLDQALRQLLPEHFEDPVLANIFQMLERYLELTGVILTSDILGEMMRSRQDPGKVALYTERFDAMVGKKASEADFRWSLSQVREMAAERATGEVLAQAMQVLRSGAQDEKGKTLKGHEDARTYIAARLSEIDKGLNIQAAPEGDMTREGPDILADYAERQAAHLHGKFQGVRFGVPSIDTKIGGLQPGELDLIAGYSSDGKTSLCVQAIWSAAVEQGVNSVYLTSETLRAQVRRKIVARHSALPMFEHPEGGINSRSLKEGTLTVQEEEILKAVVDDLTHNPAYGRLLIAQIPRGATVTASEQALYRYNRQFEVRFTVWDYLALWTPGQKRQSDRESLGGIVKEAKVVASSFDNGRGITILSPWQVNRKAREEAERLGYYTSSSLAETAEATNTADVAISVFAKPGENTSPRKAPILFQVLKNRDGETTGADRLEGEADFATSRFSVRARESGMQELLGETSMGVTTPSADMSGLEALLS